jgi:hypothetical protein
MQGGGSEATARLVAQVDTLSAQNRQLNAVRNAFYIAAVVVSSSSSRHYHSP